MTFDLFAALAAGYLIGGIPTAEIVARRRGASIFAVGSGNMGAMNVARHLGIVSGVLVLLADVGKGAAATALGMWMADATGATTLTALALPLAAGSTAVIGHAWSPFVGFRGGKALATGFGVSLPLYPVGGLYGLVLLVALALILRRAHAAAILMLLLYPFVVLAALYRQGTPEAEAFTIFTGVVLLVIVSLVKHLRSRDAAPPTHRARDL